MAELQGHLLLHKRDPQAAIDALYPSLFTAAAARARAESGLAWRGDSSGGDNGEGGAAAPTGPRRRRRVLTAHDVDKMMFNPQAGWEEMCGLK